MAKFTYVFLLSIFISGCATLQNNAKYELADGKYRWNREGKKYKCYVENNDDSIIIYKLPGKIPTILPAQLPVYVSSKQRLVKPSLDIDVLVALFKVRPQIKNVLPTQLNTNFNGNVYVGYRTDIYQIDYKKNSLDLYQRQITHIGFSLGLFIGTGNTALNASTTGNTISSEYDGIIFQKGIAGIVAVNKLTIGAGVGFDNLLDKNSTTWIYERRPWFGLMLGLNLN